MSPVVPVPSATLLLLRDRAGRLQVLMTTRHDAAGFAAGAIVFPGGKREAGDAALVAHCRAQDGDEEARTLRVAAIRETFEETGILLGAKMGDEHTDAVRSPGGPWDAFVAAGVVPDLAPVHFIARAITPPGLARRFDTRFFAIDASAIAARLDGVVGPDTELTELVWHPIAAAARMDMPAITTAVLEELAARIAAGFSHDLPVPFYRMMNRKRARSLL
jgi:8-oxo-dGTP pyrophosphatase MutT (NUDIX family)